MEDRKGSVHWDQLHILIIFHCPALVLIMNPWCVCKQDANVYIYT